MHASAKLSLVIVLICMQSLVSSAQLLNPPHVSVPRQMGLREAVREAIRRGHSTFITLAPGVHRLKPKSNGGGELLVKGSTIVIQGYGNSTVIDAADSGDRIFEVASNAVLVLSHIILRGGQPIGAAGGAVLNNGTLILHNCVVTGNSSGTPVFGPGGDGAGIYNAGLLLMYDSSVTGNVCAVGGFGGDGGNGGGIFNSGSALIQHCQITGNSAGQGGPPWIASGYRSHNGGAGGGICNVGYLLFIDTLVSGNRSGAGGAVAVGFFTLGGDGGGGAGIYNSGTLKLSRSTIATNVAGGGGTISGGQSGSGGSGGGLFNFGEATVTNCTFSQNVAGIGGGPGTDLRPGGGYAGNGGAVLNYGSLQLLSCTVCSNACDVGGALRPGGSGGGIFNQPNATVQVANTIIALNSAGPAVTLSLPLHVTPAGSGPDCEGQVESGGFNLIGIDDGTGGLTNAILTDIVGSTAQPIDPLVGPLRSNGGLTPTHALLVDSPAIDHGKRFGLAIDQCGRRRTKDNRTIPNSTGGDGTDIGAYESY